MATELDDKPPVFRRWRDLYLLLISVLAAEIAFMYWLTIHYTP